MPLAASDVSRLTAQVVAHYEPYALQWRKSEKAAMLAQIYHDRHGELKMNRVSAQRDQMVLAGMRLPRAFTGPGAHYGRYSGDDGASHL